MAGLFGFCLSGCSFGIASMGKVIVDVQPDDTFAITRFIGANLWKTENNRNGEFGFKIFNNADEYADGIASLSSKQRKVFPSYDDSFFEANSLICVGIYALREEIKNEHWMRLSILTPDASSEDKELRLILSARGSERHPKICCKNQLFYRYHLAAHRTPVTFLVEYPKLSEQELINEVTCRRSIGEWDFIAWCDLCK